MLVNIATPGCFLTEYFNTVLIFSNWGGYPLHACLYVRHIFLVL